MPEAAVKPVPNLAPEKKTIVLVGIMGVGKTTVGKRLAAILDLPFFDADEEIEKAAGMSVAEYFEKYGEAEFRKGERRVIRRLLGEGRHVLATGGGAFTDPKTRKMIKQKAVSVWLKADLDVVVERTSRRDTRPLLRGKDPREVLSRLLDERSPYYAEADIHLKTKDGPHAKTAEKIISALHEHFQ